MKNLRINAVIVGLTIGLVACSFVSLNPDAQNVVVSPNTNTLTKCKSLGDVSVSIWSKAGSFQSQDKAESQLNILARNEAAKMNGNVVIPDSEINNGQRSYKVYNCPSK